MARQLKLKTSNGHALPASKEPRPHPRAAGVPTSDDAAIADLTLKKSTDHSKHSGRD